MTWQDLKARLNEIPPERLNDKAIFTDMLGFDMEIDDVDIAYDISQLQTDPNPEVGLNNCYVLTP